MRIKLTIYNIKLSAIILLCLIAVATRAQNNYFSVVNGIPHLPVFASTDVVPTPKPGALVYSTLDATLMIYSGEVWDSFCTLQLALATNAYSQFTVVNGIPYLPVFSTTAVTSTTGMTGALYYPSDQTSLRINNSLNWFTTRTLAATPVTSSYLTSGNLIGLAGGVAFPVMAANPTFAAIDKGAVYLNSTDKMLHVNNGTAWVVVDCSICPAIASGAIIDGDWNSMSLYGGYSYYHKTGVVEGTSVYRWYVADDAAGTNSTLDPTTTIAWSGYTDALEGKYLQFKVMPRATGSYLGTAVTTPWMLLHNCPPQANGVLIDGDFALMSSNNFTFSGYSYYDKENNPEAATGQAYRWFLSTADKGVGTTTALSTDPAYTYVYTDADDGKYLNMGVITKASKGFSTSAESVISYLLKNCPPQAQGVIVTVADETFSTATQNVAASYTYYDKEANPEGTSILTYYIADNAAGANKSQLSTGSAAMPLSYTYADADQGRYLLTELTPKAATGYSTGTPVTAALKIWNCPPQAQGVIVTLADETFSTATQNVAASYTYYDKEANLEGTSTVTYYKADDATGTNKTQLSTGSAATPLSYTYTDTDQGKYLLTELTPKAATGYSTGIPVTGALKIWNCPPQAQAPMLATNLAATQTQLSYLYYDKEANAEGTSQLTYYKADDAAGTINKTQISTGTSTLSYSYQEADQGKYLLASLTPKAATGYSTGTTLTTPAVQIWNCPPQAQAVLLATNAAGTQTQLNYAYYDKEENAEGASQLTYYKADDAAGTINKTQISTGTSTLSYTYQVADQGKYLLADITPKAATGYSTGTTTTSPAVQIWNNPPQATLATLAVPDPTFSASQSLGVSYTYSDTENNAEGATVLTYYMADDAAGTTNKIQLGTGITPYTYTYAFQDADYGKYLLASISPIATAGYPTGTTIATTAVQIANCPPQVSGANISGTQTVGNTLTTGYAYYDKEGNTEATTVFQWYRGNTSTPIAGATSRTYMLTAADKGYTVGVGITPKAVVGNSTGSQVTTFTTTTIP